MGEEDRVESKGRRGVRIADMRLNVLGKPVLPLPSVINFWPHLYPHLLAFPLGQICCEASTEGKGGREGGGANDFRRGLLGFSSRGDKDSGTFS